MAFEATRPGMTDATSAQGQGAPPRGLDVS
jgi:hypothetical protein